MGWPGVVTTPARYLRIAQAAAWPYDNKYGGQRYEPKSRTPVKLLELEPGPGASATCRVEADGSADFHVPVDTPVYFQLLDENHMELRRMRSFISFQPGEQRGCVGCHETRAEARRERHFSAGLVARAVGPRAAALGRSADQLPARRAAGLRLSTASAATAG